MSLDSVIGEKYGRLTVVKFSHKDEWYSAFFEFKCDCGNTVVTSYSKVKTGRTKSCGCLRKEAQRISVLKHGLYQSRIYSIWEAMKQRCRKDPRYAGRVFVCREWSSSFIKFHDWALKNGYADNLTLDRIDNYKGYTASNCRWITQKDQSRNKRDTIRVRYKRKLMTLGELSEITSVSYHTLHNRICVGRWSVSRAVAVPIGKYERKSGCQ